MALAKQCFGSFLISEQVQVAISLYHDYFQAEQVPFQKSLTFSRNKFETLYIGQSPINILDIERGVWNVTGQTYAPPPITTYTYFTLQQYFGIFAGLLAFQTFVIFVVKYFWSLDFKNLNCLEKLLHSIETSHFAFPVHDWDHEQGSCEDHMYRMKRNRTETLIVMMINLGFNLILLFPLGILCKKIFKQFTIRYSLKIL